MTRTPSVRFLLRLVLACAALGVIAAMPASAEVLYVAASRIVVHDSESGQRLADIPLGHTVYDIAFSRDGSRAYLAVDDGVLEVDAEKHTVLGRLIDGPSFELTLSRDGKLLYVLGNGIRRLADGTQEALPSQVTIYDVAARTVVARHEVGERAEELAIVAEKAVITRPLTRELKLVGLADGVTSSVAAFTDKTAGEEVPGFINGLATSPDGAKIYLGQFGEEASIHVIDTATGARSAIPFKHHGFITGVEVSADGRTLYVSIRNHLAIINAESGVERAFVPLGGAHIDMALSADGSRSYHTLPMADEQGGAVTIVDLATGKVERTIAIPGISAVTIGVKPRA